MEDSQKPIVPPGRSLHLFGVPWLPTPSRSPAPPVRPNLDAHRRWPASSTSHTDTASWSAQPPVRSHASTIAWPKYHQPPGGGWGSASRTLAAASGSSIGSDNCSSNPRSSVWRTRKSSSVNSNAPSTARRNPSTNGVGSRRTSRTRSVIVTRVFASALPAHRPGSGEVFVDSISLSARRGQCSGRFGVLRPAAVRLVTDPLVVGPHLRPRRWAKGPDALVRAVVAVPHLAAGHRRLQPGRPPRGTTAGAPARTPARNTASPGPRTSGLAGRAGTAGMPSPPTAPTGPSGRRRAPDRVRRRSGCGGRSGPPRTAVAGDRRYSQPRTGNAPPPPSAAEQLIRPTGTK